MRMFLALLCSFLLLAAPVGLALAEPLPHGAHADASQAGGGTLAAPCGEVSGHGACQLVFAGQPVAADLAALAGSPRYEIAPVMAKSRSNAPHLPPPRQIF